MLFRRISAHLKRQGVLRYDSERILKNPDAANITSWVSGWGKYHASVMAQHHEDTIVFRDLLLERLEQ